MATSSPRPFSTERKYLMSKICCIVGGVFTENIVLPRDRFIIAADKGYEYLKNRGITPDLAVGDFDSLGYTPSDTEVLCHPIEKDDTDTLLAIKHGLAKGFRTFILYGCIGGNRIDHTIANLQALAYIAAQGGIGFLTEQSTVITAIQNSKLMFDAKEQGDISVFCLGADAEGVNIKGLHYQLTNATLTASFPLGVSNHFIGKAGYVAVKKGTLHIIWQKSIHDLISDLES